MPATIETAAPFDPFASVPAELEAAWLCGDWPPADSAELARLDEWCDRMEREAAERNGNDFGEQE